MFPYQNFLRACPGPVGDSRQSSTKFNFPDKFLGRWRCLRHSTTKCFHMVRKCPLLGRRLVWDKVADHSGYMETRLYSNCAPCNKIWLKFQKVFCLVCLVSLICITLHIILSRDVPLIKSNFSSRSEFLVGILVDTFKAADKSYPRR